MKVNWKERDWRERCTTRFERRSPGKMYVNRRWQCPRPKMKGLPYCSYCEPYSDKMKRLSAAEQPDKEEK